MKLLDERFLKPSEASKRWEAGRKQCMECEHLLYQSGPSMRCAVVKWGRESTFCIEARDGACADGKLFQPKQPKVRPAVAYLARFK